MEKIRLKNQNSATKYNASIAQTVAHGVIYSVEVHR